MLYYHIIAAMFPWKTHAHRSLSGEELRKIIITLPIILISLKDDIYADCNKYKNNLLKSYLYLKKKKSEKRILDATYRFTKNNC